MNTAEKLSADKFVVDETASHISVDKQYPDIEETDRILRICPAALYTRDPGGNFRFDYLGCLECGSCRVLSPGRVIQDWTYPAGSYGVHFRQS